MSSRRRHRSPLLLLLLLLLLDLWFSPRRATFAGRLRLTPNALPNRCADRRRGSRPAAAAIPSRRTISPTNKRTGYFVAWAMFALGARMTGISPSPTAANADQ